MRRRTLAIALVVGVAVAISMIPASMPTPALPPWGAPTWQDEFDGTAVDPAKWNVRTRESLGLTADSAVPEAGQASVEGGLLHLRGDWLPEPLPRPTSTQGVDLLTHKTGYLDQRPLQPGDVSRSQRWGRWEIRCKTPTGPGTRGALAAFWLRNENSGEIDIIEAWGYGTDFPQAGKSLKDTAKTTIFTDTLTTRSLVAQVRHREAGAPGIPWDGFHTYAFELLPDRAVAIVDGRVIWTATPRTLPALWGPSFRSPLHMRLNLHVGPSAEYWGVPDPNRRERTKPLDFQIDYVRMWEAPAS
jgi:beta-glucanase (GH16 family)